MKIYRFEHKTLGFGPLCHDGCDTHHRTWDAFFRDHLPVNTLPEYYELLPNGCQSYHKFGMTTLEGLSDLCFSYTPEDLLEYGFDLYEFEVADDSAVFFDGQVVFDSRTATRIE